MNFIDGIPGNFVDVETGEALYPVYKFKDSLGYWQEKPISLCTWPELRTAYINMWNFHMSQLEVKEVEKVAAKSLTLFDIVTIFCYIFTGISIMSALVVLAVMYFGA